MGSFSVNGIIQKLSLLVPEKWQKNGNIDSSKLLIFKCLMWSTHNCKKHVWYMWTDESMFDDIRRYI